MMIKLQLDYHLTPDQAFTYVNLPFDVPMGIGRIDVAYTYDNAISSDPTLEGGNTIDIGIADPRGPQFMTKGFRGWSGSARQRFYIAEDSATPGYMPGAIQPGTWSICLGAYKVASKGCDVHVNIQLYTSSKTTVKNYKLLSVGTSAKHPTNPDHWYKGELHCHTVNSDGDSTTEEVIAIAENLGLDFLAITDHNNRSQLIDLAMAQTTLTLIPGYEVTTYYGHWNIWGDGDWIDFRVQSSDDLHRAIQTASEQGYFVSCNHPRPYGPDWAFADVSGFAAVKVWNGPWELLNERCLVFWEARLKNGERLVAVGGSDFHVSKSPHAAQLAHPTTYFYCPEEPSAANLLRHLRARHAFVSESPTGPRLDLSLDSTMMGETWVRKEEAICYLTVHDGAGSEVQIHTMDGMAATFPITEATQIFEYPVDQFTKGYLRAQLVDPTNQHIRAITNPIYIQNPLK